MAMRRCECGVWFEYDARVRDDAVECPECGRILSRSARETWSATRLSRSLVGLAYLGGLLLVVGMAVRALGQMEAGDTLPGVLSLVTGVVLAGALVLLALTVRALADALARLEDRVP